MPRKGSRVRIAKDVYEDARGLSIVARVGTLRREKRYPKGTAIKTMRSWQKDTETELRKLQGTPVAVRRRTLAEDAEVYLAAIREEHRAWRDRARDLKQWLPRFGHRRRHTLKTAELDLQLRTWRNVDGLSASSVNHRRDALSDLFRVLDGKDAPNPVKGCVWFAREKSAPKGIDRGRIARVLAAMDPNRKTRWRLALIHWTGMRPSQQGRLEGPDDFYLDDRAFEVVVDGAPRRVPAVLVPSGKGGARVMFPLTPEGEDAARHFIRVDAFWRPPAPKPDTAPDRKPRATWSCPSAYKRIVEAAKHVEEAPFTVYQIKHSFASALLQSGTDVAVIQAMLGHADIKSTLVYARSVDATHVQALDRLRQADARRYDGAPAAAAGGAEADPPKGVARHGGTPGAAA